MSALAPMTGLSDPLGRAAGRDKAGERAYVLVVEAAGAGLARPGHGRHLSPP